MQTVNSGLPKYIQLAVRVGLKPETSGVQSQRSNRSATKIIPIIFMAYGRRELEKNNYNYEVTSQLTYGRFVHELYLLGQFPNCIHLISG